MPFEIPIHEQVATSWETVRTLLSSFDADWTFRGQADASWPLSTAIERLTLDIPIERAEDYMLKEFQRRAHHYPEASPLPEGKLDWLALMQHYGAPTRLLDFTRSPYVAAYFALEGVRAGRECAVWAVNVEWCRRTARQCLAKADKEADSLPLNCDFSESEVFEKHVMFGTCRFVVPVEPFRLHQRMTAQQGQFLCPGEIEVSFMRNLEALAGDREDRNSVRRIVLPSKLAATGLKELNLMNINRATLFPGLEGLARSLQRNLPKPHPWDRVLRNDYGAAKVQPLTADDIWPNG